LSEPSSETRRFGSGLAEISLSGEKEKGTKKEKDCGYKKEKAAAIDTYEPFRPTLPYPHY
jgi:hypothetical protein